MPYPPPDAPIIRRTPRYRFLVPAGLVFVILGVGALLVSAAPGSGGSGSYLAVLHAAESVQPHALSLDAMTATARLDPATRLLDIGFSDGDEELFWSLNGPAGPGEAGPTLFGGRWSPNRLDVGPLTSAQMHALRHGLLYLEFARPSALPEPPRALRGQLLPASGARY